MQNKKKHIVLSFHFLSTKIYSIPNILITQ